MHKVWLYKKIQSVLDRHSSLFTNHSSLSTQKGFALFFSVLIASILLSVGLAVFNIAFKEVVLSSSARESQGAFYAADTALECALFWDLKHPGRGSSYFGGFQFSTTLFSELAGHWRLDESSGAIASDSAGSNNGTLLNMNGSDWVDGQVGGGLDFDGTDDYIQIFDPSDGSLDFGTDDFTLAAWVNTVSANVQVVMSKRGGGVDPIETHYQMYTNNGLVIATIGDGVNSQTITSGTAINDGNWHHVAVVFDRSGSAEMFIDGIQSGPSRNISTIGNINNDHTVWIGRGVASNVYFDGIIDDVRAYSRLLSAVEIQELASLPTGPWVAPVNQDTGGVTCLEMNITDPDAGWDDVAGWDVTTAGESATTTFDLILPDGIRCANVEVAKTTGNTQIIARGYNNCNLNNPRRLERAIRARY